MITIVLAILIGLLFWQPQMASNYRPAPQIKMTKKGRYISNISKLIASRQYETAVDLLTSTKYSANDLPLAYWRSEVSSELSRIMRESEQIAALNNLERILNA